MMYNSGKIVVQFFIRNWVAFTLVQLFAISILSLWPADHLPSVSGSDKLHHFLAYAALSIPVSLAKPKYWPIILCFLAFWSGAIELIQPSVGRYAEWLDFVANVSGILIGFGLASVVNRYWPSTDFRSIN